MDWRRVGGGHLLFALCFLFIGAVSLGLQDFVLSQEPVPPAIPWREPLAIVSGALLLLGALGLLLPATTKVSALTLAGFFALWIVALWVPKVLTHPEVEGNWLGVGEDLTLVVGAWLIACGLSSGPGSVLPAAARADAGGSGTPVRIARALFGLALVPIGLSHFFYLEDAASLIPAWMPFPVPLTMLAGAGHIAAGVAILWGIVPRWAATTEASMETLITLIVWVSAVAAKPADHQNWVNLLISSAETAAAWMLAASYARTVAPAPVAPRAPLSG